ncbi:hypothetical protein A3D77_05220 [Candidatus Gottesmanbacteria bacterium RIFCSPHIGHO2_02_FULL_39_11]|uniref:Uncharacterized protein n=1 Tax=Candidatus Gottesmanbacteria bacterium RIFCSPHIGHO2_02_FULL_39_11 TaxID=1798382 RepID=A0A1F5ZNG2_9BACT|nr:MAG: hypothetical protein A3D77_05220 [Candidatus Gottesmanbacteria bacterium RIFCSPHIGHO2_02_FULL_39_11]
MITLKNYYAHFIKMLELSWQISRKQKTLYILSCIAGVFTFNLSTFNDIINLINKQNYFDNLHIFNEGELIQFVLSLIRSQGIFFIFIFALGLTLLFFVSLVLRGWTSSTLIQGSKLGLNGEKVHLEQVKGTGFSNWSKMICLEWDYLLLIFTLIFSMIVAGMFFSLILVIGSLFNFVLILIALLIYFLIIISMPFAGRYVIFYGFSLTTSIKKAIKLVHDNLWEVAVINLFLGIFLLFVGLFFLLASLILPILLFVLRLYFFKNIPSSHPIVITAALIAGAEVFIVNLLGGSFLAVVREFFSTSFFNYLQDKEGKIL